MESREAPLFLDSNVCSNESFHYRNRLSLSISPSEASASGWCLFRWGKPRARAWRPAGFMCVPSGCPSAEKSFTGNPPALILLLVAVHPPTPPTPRSPHSPPHSSTPRSRSLLPPSRCRAAPQCPVQEQVHQAHHRLQHPPLFHAPVRRHSVTRLRAAPLGSP